KEAWDYQEKLVSENVEIKSEARKRESISNLENTINETSILQAKKKETQILVTYWNWFDLLDKGRGYGTYLVGKWFRYRNGLLEPIFEKPTLARRLLYSFGDEIGKTQNNSYLPYLWLQSKNTHKFFTEPPDASKLINEQTGTIKSYWQNNSEWERYFSVQLDSGETIEGLLSYSIYGDRQKNNKIPITDLGLWKNKFVVPFWVDPKAIFNEIEGKKVRLETYQDEYNNKYAKLWLIDK
ncbi:MAG: hypothetical protein ABJA66_20490, partial [Actinomycetota bacterium]